MSVLGPELLRFSDRKLLFHDFESQRVNVVADNLPFQCAWLVADRKRVYSRHNYYLNWGPGFKMSKGAAQITRFNQAWVTNGHDPEFVLDAFESFAMDPAYLIVGHSWLLFDFLLWQLWREALGRKRDYSPLSRIIDTNLLSRAYVEGWEPDREDFTAWQYKVAAAYRKGVKSNLTFMCQKLGIEIDESKTHDGLYDLDQNVQVYSELIHLMEI